MPHGITWYFIMATKLIFFDKTNQHVVYPTTSPNPQNMIIFCVQWFGLVFSYVASWRISIAAFRSDAVRLQYKIYYYFVWSFIVCVTKSFFTHFQWRIFCGRRDGHGYPRDRVHRKVRGHQRGCERLRTAHHSWFDGTHDRTQRGNGPRRQE